MASQNSLESLTTIKQQEAQIKLLLQSPRLTVPIILVEGTDDATFYRQNTCATTIVIVPVNERGNGNCHEVTRVTENLHNEFSRCNVIGIRDRDYSEYEHDACTASDWVLFSEGHSLECMLLMSQNVLDKFMECLPSMSDRMRDVLDDCRHIASYYIYDAYKGLHFSFNKNKMHLVNYYNANARRMKDSWKDVLHDDFTNKCKDVPFAEIQRQLELLGINDRSDYDICRGHDIVDICYDMGKAGGIEKQQLVNEMIAAYTPYDFSNTSVAASLRAIETARNIVILK